MFSRIKLRLQATFTDIFFLNKMHIYRLPRSIYWSKDPAGFVNNTGPAEGISQFVTNPCTFGTARGCPEDRHVALDTYQAGEKEGKSEWIFPRSLWGDFGSLCCLPAWVLKCCCSEAAASLPAAWDGTLQGSHHQEPLNCSFFNPRHNHSVWGLSPVVSSMSQIFPPSSERSFLTLDLTNTNG